MGTGYIKVISLCIKEALIVKVKECAALNIHRENKHNKIRKYGNDGRQKQYIVTS